MKKLICALVFSILLVGCGSQSSDNTKLEYFDNSGRDDVLSGGVRLIPITTDRGTFNVWTKRVGNNPAIKVLLLHGGPGATHQPFEVFDYFLPAAGIEYYYYKLYYSFTNAYIGKK